MSSLSLLLLFRGGARGGIGADLATTDDAAEIDRDGRADRKALELEAADAVEPLR